MSEISEEEDALLARMLLNTDLVSEENVEKIRQLQSSFREQGVKVSIVDLLIQSGFLSRSDLNTLRALVDEEIEQGEAVMPSRFEYPFLTQPGLADQAKEEGLISEETYQRVNKIKELFDRKNINKSTGEILVEQGFVEPRQLQFDEDTSDEERLDATPAGTTDRTTTDAAGQGGGTGTGQVMTELDKYVLEELVDRGRIERAQIPDIVQQAKRTEVGSGETSPVQAVLREKGLLHPTTENEIFSSAMERRESTQNWRRQFSGFGPIGVTVVLLLGAVVIVFAFYGGEEKGQSTGQTSGFSSDDQSEPKSQQVARKRTDNEARERESTGEKKQETKPEEQGTLLTFEANLGPVLSGQNCECDILYDGRAVTSVSGAVNDRGILRIEAVSASERDSYAAGVYVLDCTIKEPPGDTLPSFPLQIRYPLEEYGPVEDPLFDGFLNGDLWNFFTVTLHRSSDVQIGRGTYASKLRRNLGKIVEQWERVEPHMADTDSGNRRLREGFKKITRGCRTLADRLRETEKYQAFYYPAIREQALKVLDELPRAIARVINKQRKNQDADVSQRFVRILRKIAGSGSGGSLEAVRSLVGTLNELVDELPGDEDPDPFRYLKPHARKELRKLKQVERTLILLQENEDVRRLAIEQEQDMAKYYLMSLFKYARTQIVLRSIVLNNVSDLRIFDKSVAERVESLSDKVKQHLHQVLLDLAGEYGIELPDEISDGDRSAQELRDEVVEILRSAGIDVSDLSEQD